MSEADRVLLFNLPKDVLIQISQNLNWKHRNLLFSINKFLHNLHSQHCLHLPLPHLTITTESEYDRYRDEYPISLLLLNQKIEGNSFQCFQIMVDPEEHRTFLKAFFMEALVEEEVEVRWIQRRDFCGKVVSFHVIGTNEFGSACTLNDPQYEALNSDVINYRVPTPHYYCWNGEAQIHLFDGTTKNVEDVKVGDVLLGASGQPTVVKRVKETAIHGEYQVVDMGDFYITKGHPIFHENEWYRPDELFPVMRTFIDTLYNFYAEPEHFLVVGKERVICSSLGGYCPRLAEMDPFTDVLYGRGYGSYEAEHYKWLLTLKERIPDSLVYPKIPSSYDDLYPGRESIVILGRTPQDETTFQ